MQTNIRVFRSLSALVAMAVVCAASVNCGGRSPDQLYGFIGSPAEPTLVTFDVRGVKQVTTTPVGKAGVFGCAALARSAAGVLYTVCGPGIVKPGPQQLATVDPKTGHATVFGKTVEGLQVMAIEFAPNGTLYAVGDANGASPTFNSLYTVDVKTGEFTRVGSTGVPAPEFFMDFAVDRNGTMYGATSHALFTLDVKTGTATKVVDFVGGGDIMGLSYDASQDKLYATDFKAPAAALYVVDSRTGFLTPMAGIGYPYAHGLIPVIR